MKNNNIKIVSTFPGLESIEECKPRPAKSFIPSWWKSLPVPEKFDNFPNIRMCPSFPDYFSQGFIIPMWSDSLLHYQSETDELFWKTGLNNDLGWSMHPKKQLLDHMVPEPLGSECVAIIKAQCPWRVITPKGYSVLQLPVFFDFNKDFSIVPGIIDTDVHHEVNPQIMLHTKDKDVFIERGSAFVQYIPFKRTKYNLEILSNSDKFQKMFDNKNANFLTKIIGEGSYRQMQRERDKK
jgi:hypothetical protein